MKIFDCSNSSQIKKDKFYGPKENDIIRYLKENAHLFGHLFVDDWKKADVILTNDIFPGKYDKYKVKRMDGIFSLISNKNRNHDLNNAALEANNVIFISQFSKDSYFKLYNSNIKNHCVILNSVDPNHFHPPDNINFSLKNVISSASDWSRPEKRLKEIISIANNNPNINFIIIGTINSNNLPKNIITKNYINNPIEIGHELRKADAMISLFYKDACPKTLIQGIYCGLPVLYSNSGGQPELVQSGISISDDNVINFDNSIPNLNIEEVNYRFNELIVNFKKLKEQSLELTKNIYNEFQNMLENYFQVLTTHGG